MRTALVGTFLSVVFACSFSQAEETRYPVSEVKCSPESNTVRLSPSSQPDVGFTRTFAISKRDCKSISEAVELAKRSGNTAKIVAQFSADGKRLIKVQKVSSGGVRIH